MRKFVYVSEMLIVRHLGTPNSDFNGCHCMRDPVLYRSMLATLFQWFLERLKHLIMTLTAARVTLFVICKLLYQFDSSEYFELMIHKN